MKFVFSGHAGNGVRCQNKKGTAEPCPNSQLNFLLPEGCPGSRQAAIAGIGAGGHGRRSHSRLWINQSRVTGPQSQGNQSPGVGHHFGLPAVILLEAGHGNAGRLIPNPTRLTLQVVLPHQRFLNLACAFCIGLLLPAILPRHLPAVAPGVAAMPRMPRGRMMCRAMRRRMLVEGFFGFRGCQGGQQQQRRT